MWPAAPTASLRSTDPGFNFSVPAFDVGSELVPMASRGMRVAVIDSGIYADHPHINGVAGGVAIDGEGREHADFTDRLGHGTAVAAAIRDQAPEAELFAVKIFDRQLSSNIGALVAA